MALLSAAVAIRVMLAWVSPGVSYDMESYQIQGRAVLTGQNIYEVTYRYPYPPLWMYWPAAALKLADSSGTPFHFWVKLLAILADVGIGWLLWAWPSHPDEAARRAALYWFNPVVLIVSAVHGQFDSLVIFGVVLAARFWIDRRSIPAALSLGFAVALKGFPLLLLPAFIIGLASWSQAIVFVALAASIFVVISVPYLASSGTRVMGIVLRYNSTADHSYGYILNSLAVTGMAVAKQTLDGMRSVSRWLEFGAVLGVAAVGAMRRWSLEQRLAVTLFAIYAVAPGLASQQMMWVVPFLILIRRLWSFWIYTIVSTLALLLFYAQNFPAAIFLSAPASGDVLLAGRMIVEAIWWFGVVGSLGAMLLDRRAAIQPTA